MRSDKRVYLDTNILIYAFEGGGPDKGRLSELLAGNDGTRPAYLFTSELTLAEVLVHPLSHNDVHLVQSYDNVLNNSAILTTCPIDRTVLWHAAVLRSHYSALKLPDAIHLSTAMRLRCTHFLSADTGLGQSYDLPHATFNDIRGPVSLQVIRPDTKTLDGLNSEFAI